MKIKPFNHSTRSGPPAWPLGLSTCLGLVLAATVCTAGAPVQPAVPDVSNDYTIQNIEPPDGIVFDGVNSFIMNFWINDSGMGTMSYWTPDSFGCGKGAILEKGVWKDIVPPIAEPEFDLYAGPCNPTASGRIAICYNDRSENLLHGSCVCHHATYHQGDWDLMGGYPTYTDPKTGVTWNWCFSLMSDNDIITCYAWNQVEIAPGEYGASSGGYHGLLVDKTLSLFKIFNAPNSSIWTWALGINNAGMIVGYYLNDKDKLYHGFLSDWGDTFVNLDVPGHDYTVPYFINNSGEICGLCNVGPGNNWSVPVVKGFLFRNGKFSTFNVPGAVWMELDCITDSGKLAGYYNYVDKITGKQHQCAFIATPKHGRK